MEVHDGRPSSRVKDLVDLAVYLTKERFAMSDLQERLRLETALHGLDLSGGFSVPDAWRDDAHASHYARLAGRTGLPSWLMDVGAAEDLVRSCVDAALGGESPDACVWDPTALSWVGLGD